jgi:CheY-like chemotaxis protein
MDVQMPEMDGLESTRAIRRDIANEQQPRIVAMTANAMEGDREACLAAGMDDYISKPIRLDQLELVLKHTTARAELQRQTPVVDREALARLIESLGGKDSPGVVNLLDTFFANGPKLIADMRAAVAASDATSLTRAAHTMKSTAATFGGGPLSEAARQLEASARAGSVPGSALDAIAALDELFGQTEAAIRRWLEG